RAAPPPKKPSSHKKARPEGVSPAFRGFLGLFHLFLARLAAFFLIVSAELLPSTVLSFGTVTAPAVERTCSHASAQGSPSRIRAADRRACDENRGLAQNRDSHGRRRQKPSDEEGSASEKGRVEVDPVEPHRAGAPRRPAVHPRLRQRHLHRFRRAA